MPAARQRKGRELASEKGKEEPKTETTVPSGKRGELKEFMSVPRLTKREKKNVRRPPAVVSGNDESTKRKPKVPPDAEKLLLRDKEFKSIVSKYVRTPPQRKAPPVAPPSKS